MRISGWWRDDRDTLDGRGLQERLWVPAESWPGVARSWEKATGHDICPTRLLSTFLWEEDGPAALLWPPKRRAVRVVEEGADSQTELL